MSEYIVDMYCEDRGIKCGPIVRCRDCKHFEDGVCYRPDGDGDYARLVVEPDGFCAWGERRQA